MIRNIAIVLAWIAIGVVVTAAYFTGGIEDGVLTVTAIAIPLIIGRLLHIFIEPSV